MNEDTNMFSGLHIFLAVLSILVMIFMGVSAYSVGRTDKVNEKLDYTKEKMSELYVTKDVFTPTVTNIEKRFTSLDKDMRKYMECIDVKLETIILRNTAIDALTSSEKSKYDGKSK
jgi:Na+-transporting methylmalonyl-CoA/oxaloacetate decarboxylase gamma subunit